ncbi:PAS domain-containing protein [Virgibacillus halodenitrificans]|uniref:PAS domain-containing protein n=1 Tax=Virgibacillus halodenitrificans TaxID=1482 RepID=UPI0002DDE766|nr:PAS domain-containing protein [Virgibacillus halodenitrificans]MCG1028969.1 PAS domain-containing protein [Virgibacillus halodenitrificans]MCJ0933235.1 PAS domain-containing protein [Virgibacillus halodenitrificans]MEC2160835.1 PAS domain-containing protein [Virgibacillus halodenitrificans]WHX27825.1 PAS domain-containing protein [Virgibacillus halodenitrificans]
MEVHKKSLHLFEKALNFTKVGLVITDPAQKDNPIIFVNEGFLNMTGYSKEEIVGNNCRFLQGVDTDTESVQKVRDAIKNEQSITIQLYNYKKDGTGFWNELSIDPMWLEEEQELYFVGVQKDVTIEKEQSRLLDNTLKEMELVSTPIVPITNNASILPIIGDFNDNRYEIMFNKVSSYLETAEEDYLIVDLSGLHEVDTYIASKFLKLQQLVSLMGKELVVAGMRPELAAKTTSIQGSFTNLSTFHNVKTAIEYLQRK